MRRLLVLAVVALMSALLALPASANGHSTTHIVDRGETLARIARHYGVSLYDLLAANPSIYNPNHIWAGMVLIIPSGDTQPPQPQPPVDPGVCAYYVVRYGDTLSGIAAWYGVSAWDIAYYNGIYNLNHIYAGMYLRIPCGYYPAPQPPHQPQPPYYPHVIHYTVLPGDNLTSIAYRYGTTVQDILALNPLTIPYGNTIYRGQVIQVPVGPNAPGY